MSSPFTSTDPTSAVPTISRLETLPSAATSDSEHTHRSAPDPELANTEQSAAWWKSKPRSQNLDAGHAHHYKQSGSNAIPLGHGNITRGQPVMSFSSDPSNPPVDGRTRTVLPDSSAPFSSRDTSRREDHDIYVHESKGVSSANTRLLEELYAQAEEISGYKRTVELLLEGEQDMKEELRRLNNEKEQTLEVIKRMQEEAIRDEGWDGVIPSSDLMSTISSSYYHLWTLSVF